MAGDGDKKMESRESPSNDRKSCYEQSMDSNTSSDCSVDGPGSVASPPNNANSSESKICGVCGDKALGYNFNAITCESCKAFFRRNALKQKDFKCPFNGDCKVDTVTRRFCQKCRLKKCFDVGMKKEWIMTEQEKQLKKQKIEENRQKRQHDGSSVSTSESPPLVAFPNDGETCKIIPNAFFICSEDGKISAIPELKMRLPGKTSIKLFSKLSTSSPPLSPPTSQDVQPPSTKIARQQSDLDVHNSISPQSDALSGYESQSPMSENNSPAAPVEVKTEPIQAVETKPEVPEKKVETKSTQSDSIMDSFYCCSKCVSTGSACKCWVQQSSDEGEQEKLGLLGSVLEIAIKSEFSNSSEQTETIAATSLGLSGQEEIKLGELMTANKAMMLPLPEQHLHLSLGADKSLLNIINMTDIAIRRLIKMSKRISAFKNLCQDDQIALLKGGCTELMILRSVMAYNPENDCWQVSSLALKVGVLREARGNLYEEHKRFIQSFDTKWRTNEKIMMLLSAITLFNPDRPNVIHQDVVRLEQDSYYYLLRQYLKTIYVGCEAKSNYLLLIRQVQQLRLLNENHVRAFLEVNPREVEPLLIEIFDLKSR